MKNPLMYTILISCLSILIFGILIYNSITNLDYENISTETAQGKRFWESYGCVECHAIFGNGGYSAPELTKTYTERGQAWLEDFFHAPPVMRPSTKKNHLSLPEGESTQIIEYLRYVSQIQLLDWPPKSIIHPEKEQVSQ